jgi:cyclohexadienyl dehydratase
MKIVSRLQVVLVALLLSAAGNFSARADSVLSEIHTRGTLRVGTTGDYKPFSFRAPDGTYSGADIDMARDLAKTLGVQIAFVPTSWSQMQADFAGQKFDIAVGGVTILPAREKIGDFSHVTYVDGKRPVARCADRAKYVSIAAIDQPGVRVVVNPGASNEEFARKNFPDATLIVHADNPTVPDEIIAGRADVFVTDGIEVAHIAAIHPELCPTDVPALFTRLEKAYWLQRDPAFLTAVNTWLDGEISSGAWKQTLDSALKAP